MRFTNIRDLKYITADKSMICLFATCEEYGEIPMALNLVDTENLHTFVNPDSTEVPLEEYCKTLEIGDFEDFTTDEQREQQRVQEIESKCNQEIEAVYPIYKQINITNLLTPYTEEDKDAMKAFIDSKRAVCHQAIADGTNAEDINWEATNG